jgi:phosphohistidine phosphatase
VAAPLIAAYIKEHHLEPSLVLCSSAVRARETLELVRPGLSANTAIEIEPGLYGAGPEELLARMKRLPPAVDSVLLIGHNPGMQELVLMLAVPNDQLEAIRVKFPTAALALLEADVDEWSELGPGRANLDRFTTPKTLDS